MENTEYFSVFSVVSYFFPFIHKTFDTIQVDTLLYIAERILLISPGLAHTSGDTVIVFRNSRVIQTGDLFFHDIAPFIDVVDGANTQN